MEFLIITFLISISLILFYLYIKKEKNKYSNIVYLKNLQQIKDFVEQMNRFSDYVTWIEREQIKSNYSNVGKFFKNKTKYYKKEETVKKFNDIFSNFDNFIASYNQNYVNTQKEKLEQYFDDIEGKKLDDQQRTALITDEYSNLIIAGAGSGKTLTILGKVKYLVEKKNISSKEILLLSFTKKTVEELNERLKKLELDVEATTFHKLSYDVIKKYQSFVPSVTNENTLSSVIKEYLKTDILNNSIALQSYIQYVACYMNIPEDSDNYDSLGDKIDNEKGIDLQTLKSKCESLNKISKSSLDTIQGERVKSVEELIIANFLYLNGINYEYEKPYPFGEVIYRPDFYLKDYDIYLEYFGVDENNRAKWLNPFNEKEYLKGMQIKREAHKKYNTKLIETYSYYNRDNILIQKLTEMLENCNVSFKPINTKLIYTKVSNNDENFGN
ncbi:UvrD-helicase domain-containing protein [Cloacibacterium sp.]|uniref:UvrD-helicase domain-containing protein n=1 Tax=Cloacibacterium sp. TaxID=1913682 RepID=UPI0039E6909D